MSNAAGSPYAQGFFAAIVAGPMVMPSEFLQRFISVSGASAIELKESAMHVFAAYNDIADLVQRRPNDFIEATAAFAGADSSGTALIGWHRGFRDAMNLRPNEWRSLNHDPDTPDLLTPLTLVEEALEAPQTLESEFLRERLCRALGTMTIRVAETFRKRLVAQMQQKGVQARRQEPRISRNDPCPCGSGKKYKRCCG